MIKNKTMTDKKINVLLVDDYKIVRETLAAYLGTFADIEVVGEASNGAKALGMCYTVSPDVVVMDMIMPWMDGVAATHAITKEHPKIMVIALSQYNDMIEEALDAGASKGLLKGGSITALIEAIRESRENN